MNSLGVKRNRKNHLEYKTLHCFISKEKQTITKLKKNQRTLVQVTNDNETLNVKCMKNQFQKLVWFM